MHSLDRRYSKLLQFVLLMIREAIDACNLEWIRHEIEWLHNVPSLIDETSIERHRYLWQQVRPHYLPSFADHSEGDA
jgi:hypothetical protein